MAKQVEHEDWFSKSHQEIYNTAQAFLSAYPQQRSKRFADGRDNLHRSAIDWGKKIQDELFDGWSGEAAKAMQTDSTKFLNSIKDYAEKVKEFGDKLPLLKSPMDAAREIEPPMNSQQEKLLQVLYEKVGHSESDAKKLVSDEKDRLEHQARLDMTSKFSSEVVNQGSGASMGDEEAAPPPNGPIDTGTGGGGGGNGGGNQNGGGAGDKLKSSGDGLGNTKPASDEGAGQGQGQGGGQGGGQGSGSGGGSPAGGGSGSGSGLGSGLGTDSKGGSGYSPLGSTTAAGYSPTSAAGAGAGAGLGSLRAGGLPPGAAGAGTGGAGAGGAGGMRGGGMGMGGMGMAPMGGAHGRGGNGEDDDEHETPDYLINMDNGSELFGNLPKASPGVIGDWSEHDEVEKRREEAEIKRYKSMGWNVKWQ
ncbi:hypothetical protein [Mycobacteroides franklinii]|uniref:hypothetical protein n=1 Tax=Mycobacteroides franklinii TaxID=948102 RepID=UPI0013E8D8C2|nr:hypothetical protein [Mycobacteroides franklinii]